MEAGSKKLCNNEALSLASEAFELACKKGTAKKPKKTICKQTQDVAWLLPILELDLRS